MHFADTEPARGLSMPSGRTPPTGLAIRRDALRRGGYEEVGNDPQENDAADALRPADRATVDRAGERSEHAGGRRNTPGEPALRLTGRVCRTPPTGLEPVT